MRYEDGEFDEEVGDYLDAECERDDDGDCVEDEEEGAGGVGGEVTDDDSATPEEAALLKSFEEMEGMSEE